MKRSVGSSVLLAEDDRDRMLASINDERDWYGVAPLRWDSDIEANAVATANQCLTKHSATDSRRFVSKACGGGSCLHGENLGWRRGGRQDDKNWEKWQEMFNSERNRYDCVRNTSFEGKSYGHWQQNVWTNTTHVGCALNCDCREISWWDCFYVCQYGRAGNIVGQRPFPFERCADHPREPPTTTTTTTTTTTVNVAAKCDRTPYLDFRGHKVFWEEIPSWREWCDQVIAVRTCQEAYDYSMKSNHDENHNKYDYNETHNYDENHHYNYHKTHNYDNHDNDNHNQYNYHKTHDDDNYHKTHNYDHNKYNYHKTHSYDENHNEYNYHTTY
ncbi:MAG: hypothetical protein KVP17_004208 [Porospora cf. gigantea B]|uniref:uncharacterized protein n=1 Tax=Porospora cf. gigantea B TaxID=2853592 RepID=UPI0035719E72|nr:MAG: hypothetical protein KVP17_004208 [Porospora cf. gigantea B]